MTAMIEETLSGQDHTRDDDQDDDSSIPEMFRSTSGLLDSLDKLTKEIQANLKSDEDPGSLTASNESSSNDDEDFYWEDEENYYSEDDDPDSGENKLFSMMDELVVELMMELKDENLIKDGQSVVDEENDESIINKGENTSTEEILDKVRKDDNKNIVEPDELVAPSIACTPSNDCGSPTSNLNSTHVLDDDREEKQKKLHEHVKTLLRQVEELTKTMNTKKRKSIRNEYNDKISANIQKKIEEGDNDADGVEHLVGAVATYSKFKDANTNAIASFTSPSKPNSATSLKKNKLKKRTNKHKRRKSKSFVQTHQSLQILYDSLEALDKKLSREKS
mmetsp:Transcript_6193/g.15329  ORF Transcript_6193/g.15329 Transcript_6193/m.15329 type:complete len:334 (+) Transcript_6193:173-1174(+)|eukprot:CAMPEP_0197173398 /NCGR_PEP_ID=MMETSP1423-20130617/349_1 /TAXON_ID=476441 /ORGANISM="Pseudo-nitzschia heimii, Strain UNC1101" /LENGTH=333 /DNA_ID=CAMNT_0042622213 /DNA_START=160 /DNA_END=1161 /DNA_ORIENTATION=+